MPAANKAGWNTGSCPTCNGEQLPRDTDASGQDKKLLFYILISAMLSEF